MLTLDGAEGRSPDTGRRNTSWRTRLLANESTPMSPEKRSVQRRRVVGRHREGGAALVEFALVVTLFLMMIFGVIEFGIDYSNYIAVRNGEREGARLAVVNDINNAPSCQVDGSTYTPPATPATTTDAAKALICKTKSRIGLDASKVKVEIVAGANPGDSVEICASYPVSTITGLVAPFVSGKQLVARVTMRLEQFPSFASYQDAGAAIC
jgi:Flp pilus assembly protein TadG